MGTRTTRSAVLGSAFFAFLAWRGAVTFAACARELLATDAGVLRSALTWSEDQRIRATLAARDERLEVRRGLQYELYRAVMDHVEPEGQVLALAEPGRGKNTVGPLHFLIFPRIVVRLETLPPEIGDAHVEHVYVLDFEGAHEDALASRCSSVARGPDWSLWRL